LVDQLVAGNMLLVARLDRLARSNRDLWCALLDVYTCPTADGLGRSREGRFLAACRAEPAAHVGGAPWRVRARVDLRFRINILRYTRRPSHIIRMSV
jgi:hypothetical protein